jgi:hypothetical protein
MFIYSVIVRRLWVDSYSGLLSYQVMINLVWETTVNLISCVSCLTRYRSDLS